MTIERTIARLTAKREKPGDVVTSPPAGAPVIGEMSIKRTGRSELAPVPSGRMRMSGPASLDDGNDWHGLPQAGMELRAVAETVIDLGSRSGQIIINLARANVFRLNLTAAATIVFTDIDWPKAAYQRGAAAGLDYSASLLITKGTQSLSIGVDHWAPKRFAPDLSKAGFYEIAIARCVIGNTSITRGYPAIVTA